MKNAVVSSLALAVVISSWPLTAPAHAEAQPQPPPKVVKIPEPGVPQIMTIQGRYIRVAYNNEGYAIVGYRTANQSVGQEWMLLDVGLTLRDGVPSYTLKREALSLETPDGKTIPLPSNVEYRKADLSAMQNRAKASRDPINYFPPKARTAQRLGFFADLDSKSSAWDQVELSFQRGTVGELFFPVPGGIKYGQYWLNVKFKESVVRVPFRILTEEEYKLLDKNFEDIKKQVDEAFKTKG